MGTLSLAAAAALLGALSVTLFSRGWMSLLAMIAAGILFFRGRIPANRFLRRAFIHWLKTVAYAMALAVSFRFYLTAMGLGSSTMEQVAYFLGCLPGLLLFLAGISRRIDALFDPEDRA